MTEAGSTREPITEDWLREVGFKWHQVERQPNKQWCLWLSQCFDDGAMWRFTGAEDLGIELAYSKLAPDDQEGFWFCWLRGDTAGRYHRFIHIRHLRFQSEVIQLVEAFTALPWNPANHFYGVVYCGQHAARMRQEQERFGRPETRGEITKWYEAEKDDTRDRALPEHLDEAIKSGKAK